MPPDVIATSVRARRLRESRARKSEGDRGNTKSRRVERGDAI